ncbi:aminotransferase class V-fold PLP-dependent enzyme [Bacillaceae bacterium S4-13-58]
MIYFDQAASSFPKPASVSKAVLEAIQEYGANPGRGGHALSRRASSVIKETRSLIANFFGCSDPNHVLFFQNATGALNQAIKGFPLEEGDHIISSSFEHNSVRRPLEELKRINNINISYIGKERPGFFSLEEFEQAITPRTKLITITHGSNVTGTILPIEKISKIAKEFGIKVLVDASQTAGILPIHMKNMNIDMLAFPGHKGLMGPQGTGVLLVEGNINLNPIFHGGTGSFSESPFQPEQWPEKFESGTLNTPGIAGLKAGLEEVIHLGLDEIVSRETFLINHFIDQLSQIDDIQIYKNSNEQGQLGVVSFTLGSIDSNEVAMILDEYYGIAVRAGVHCAPMIHEKLGTLETGAIRVSVGPYNTKEEVDSFIQAMKEIRKGYLG